MLDATFIRPSAKLLNEAGRLRRSLIPNLQGMGPGYIHPSDAKRAVDRVKARVRNYLRIAKYHNARAKLYTQGDNWLRAAQQMQDHGQPLVAAAWRNRAQKFFDAVDRVPLPDLD